MRIAIQNFLYVFPKGFVNYSKAEERYRLGLLTQLYIWSIIFEPLLLFLIGSQATTGVGLNLGRILQVGVLIGLIFRFLMKPSSIRIPNPFNDQLRFYFLFIFYTIFAGALGLLLGKYIYTGTVLPGQSVFAFINTPSMRPIWEYITLLFQFIYFILLAPYFIRGGREVSYFFKAFSVMAMVHLVVGLIDFAFSTIGVDIVPRHLSDWRHVGVRFHGIAGEPRDAFVYMITIIFILGLKSLWERNSIEFSTSLVAIIAFSLIATQSGSGIVGLFIAILIIPIFGFNKISFRRIGSVILLIFLALSLVYIAFKASDRLQVYLTYSSVVQELFSDTSLEVPFLVQTQYNNIYPIIELYQDLINLNPIPMLFGSGLGSSGFANSRTGVYESFTNPHSQITRTVFETGLFGTFLFIYAIRKVSLQSTEFLSRSSQQYLLWLIMLLLGCSLAHRSTNLVICIGVLYAVTQQLHKRSLELRSST